jgi:hypothetical protein
LIKINDLRNEVKKSSFPNIILVVCLPENYLAINLEILRTLLNEMKFSGIYITINRPSLLLRELLKSKDIDVDKLYFIDCVSCLGGIPSGKDEKCYFIKSPSALIDIGITVSELMEAIEKPAFMLLDSVSTLLIYNNAKSVVSLSHVLITKMRLRGFSVVIVSLKKDMEIGTIRTLTQFCDKIIEVV